MRGRFRPLHRVLCAPQLSRSLLISLSLVVGELAALPISGAESRALRLLPLALPSLSQLVMIRNSSLQRAIVQHTAPLSPKPAVSSLVEIPTSCPALAHGRQNQSAPQKSLPELLGALLELLLAIDRTPPLLQLLRALHSLLLVLLLPFQRCRRG